MRSLVKRAAQRLLGEYELNFVYAASGADAGAAAVPEPAADVLSDLSPFVQAMAEHPDAKVRSALSFERAGLPCRALVIDGRLASAAHFADRRHYANDAIWPLGARELALVNIVTLPEFRGQGAAGRLIAAATADFLPAHDRLIAFIWWSNRPSVRAFEKAGWRRAGFSAAARPLGMPLRLRLPLR